MSAIVVTLIVAIVLLTISTILSAMAAVSAQKNDIIHAHRYASISAVISGVSVAALFIALFLYFKGGYLLKEAHTRLGEYI